uniref:phosphogluconate dehydrogenase (NADP(+)-dependent, decarboxylating) n=1 Tax=Phaseolus vulgaris TaxID=3885 RepID=V7CS80_PHAVU|nr:hypothetical protein PHAVU_002G295200g [Phaseolus vulgaris]ESW32125.1 hypothetical protein PHAVU_002G295200g [Phaseolus vulgaris]
MERLCVKNTLDARLDVVLRKKLPENRTLSKVDETIDRARNPSEFILSLQRPRSVIILVKAGTPVDQTIAALSNLEPGDCIIDGGNEWYENTERRISQAAEKGLLYLGMGISGGENGARYGPSLMPGGSKTAYDNVHDILHKIAAQVDDGPQWIRIQRYATHLGCLQRVEAYRYEGDGKMDGKMDGAAGGGSVNSSPDDCGVVGLQVLERVKGGEGECCDGVEEGELARIWKGGCITSPVFLDRIKKAYQINPNLTSLIDDPEFTREMKQRQAAWRRVLGLAVSAGISTPGMAASLAYFDTVRSYSAAV